ncbi:MULTISPECIES: serine-threonine protein kinase [unclassified Streptomyces]|uniref:serine-threonine protein kinase n=1 Tax=unclassified Streptomyces TaxID=2593676 RepID=UPI000DC7E573|nr:MULTISPECIES: serine-threonine protein kinase [unclassified Streptomyces]AWZ10925.1 serine-threonine protein kinase [Streptomyces sp. ICC4]AWZ18591.1 serine-threonine protein kinase [Streptomyces sp. ICC1]
MVHIGATAAAGAAGIGAGPYVELTYDAEGDAAPGAREAVFGIEATDLLVFAHGWNSDRSTATRLFDRFYAPFADLVGTGVRLGYAGVVWPSIRFSDEPIPDFDALDALGARDGLAEPGHGTALAPATRRALGAFWPGRAAELDRIAELLEERPALEGAFTEFGALVRELAGVDGVGAGDDLGSAFAAREVPAFLTEDVLRVCREFTDALAEAGAACPEGPAAPGPSAGPGLRTLWSGAKEVLRQATYYQMKARAGVVGQYGLGPVLAELAHRRPALRVHLIGHSFGGRVVSFALRALPAGARNVKSLTLLQGAFSHYAFADSLPHDRGRGGALRGLQHRVDGPVTACHSSYDSSLKVFYPLASRMAGDSAGLLGFDERWGAIGHDGVRGVPGAPRLTLDAALRDGLPAAGCVSVDAGSVVRRGGAPSGAHSDICHEELARLVVVAGRMGR